MEYKTRLPYKSKRGRGKGSPLTAFVLLISIGLIALIIVFSPLGPILQDSVIQPIVSCFGKNPEDEKIVSVLQTHDEQKASPSPSEVPAEKSEITVEAVPFYILQMGVYTDQTDAEKHSEEILLLGGGGNVFRDGNVYRVFAAAYKDEESVLKVQKQVEKDGFEATPYITDRSGMKITMEGDARAIQIVSDTVSYLSSIPQDLCELTLGFDKNEYSEKEVTDKLKQLLQQCSERKTALQSIRAESIGPISVLLEKYAESISTFLHKHDTINTMKSGELKQLQLSVIIDYILFFQQE